MAEVILSPLLQVCFDKLADPMLESFKNLCNLEKDMNKLKDTLAMIQAVLEDAEEQQVKDKLVRIWLEKLKEVAYDADDLLENFIVRNTEQLNGQMPYEVMFLSYKSTSKLNHIQDKFDTIMAEKTKFQFKKEVAVETAKRKQTGSFTVETKVYGRAEDKEKIIELLIQTNSVGISVIPIVGIGGLGKTTLARLAYNDERVNKNFEIKMWVCVTDEFDVMKLMRSIIESATKGKCDILVMDALQSKLWELLSNKRYLLVLDDVWNEDQDEWDELQSLLRGGAAGSKIIVTTRSKKVAAIMGTTGTYDLQVLSEDDCWGLFKQRAFAPGDEEMYPNLFTIGKQIVKKCGGVPLAAMTVGSVMRFKREEREWLFVQESELWDVCEGEPGILPALRLSYNHLPTQVKPCFAYSSIFPKNYAIKKESLIRQWIAHDFVTLGRRSIGIIGNETCGMTRTLEDIGNEYFSILLGMSFFQDATESVDGFTKDYRMHDVIHDLATFVAGREFKILESGHVSDNFGGVRHSSIICDSKLSEVPEDFYAAEKLRTLLALSPRSAFSMGLPKIFSTFTYLRVLHLSGCDMESLPPSVCNLTCLRYIDLSYTWIKELPEELSRLNNLQNLDLLDCYNLLALPINMCLMRKLRHLNIKGCDSLAWMPALIGNLRQLQTLPIFIVGEEEERSISQLGPLDLQGELYIKRLECVRSGEATKANLKAKRHLNVLGLSWGMDNVNLNVKKEERPEARLFRMTTKQRPSAGPSTSPVSQVREGCNVEDSVDCLAPNGNLKKLLIRGYSGSRFPCWMTDIQLPHLTEILLINCQNWEQFPALGQLPSLKLLYMHRMPAVTHIQVEFYGANNRRPFPSLKELTLDDFPNLGVWLREVFPEVVKLTINKCPKLMMIPHFPSLKYLEIRWCSAIILRKACYLPSLRTLVIDVVPELQSLPVGLLLYCSKLTSLTISSCPDLRSLPSEMKILVALKSLTIRWCEQLVSLPKEICNLVSLESLEISECHSIVSLPEEGMEGLIALRTLSIENCNNLTQVPIGARSLASLEHLMIMYCPKLASLPADLKNLVSLRSLSIINCPELALLPEGLQHVKNLQNMEIRSCPGLTAIPEWIDHLTSLRSLSISDCQNLALLPEGLQGLNALQHLSIQECPSLECRCEKSRGEDWRKISHIPHIYIGSIQLTKLDEASSSSC